MTPRALFAGVLQDLGVLGVGDRFSNANAEAALSLANDWLDSQALDGMVVYYLPRTLKTLASGTASYTIGTGGQINLVRPTEITRAGLIIDTAADPTTEVPIAVFTDAEWALIRQKGLTSPLIQGVHFDKSWTAGLGTVHVWPVPTVDTTQLVLYTPQALTQYADLDVDVTYPPGYKRFIRAQLRKAFAGSWGKTLSAEQVDDARDSRALVKRSNIRPVEITLDPRTPGLGGDRGRPFDWRTGQ